MLYADPDSPVFEPDPRHLVQWALQHDGCCRRTSREIMALVSVGKVERAWRAAIDAVDAFIRRYPPNDYPPRPEWPHCIRQLQEAARDHQELSASDYAQWHAAHAVPKPISVVNDLFWPALHSTRRDTTSETIARAKQYEASAYVFLVWPDYVDESLSLEERVRQCLTVERTKLFEENGRYLLLSTFNLYDEGNRRSVTILSEVVELIFRHQWPLIERLVWSILHKFPESGPGYDRDDQMQIARIAVWNAIARFRCESKFSTYAYSVVRNALIDHRRAMRDSFITQELIEETVPSLACDDPAAAVGAWDELVAALQSTVDGDLLILRALGFADEELGSRGTVRQRRKRAADKIRTLLDAGRDGLAEAA